MSVLKGFFGSSGGGGGGVTALNTLTGALTLAAGSNITITPSGSTLTIASSGGGFNGDLSGSTLSDSSDNFINIGDDIGIASVWQINTDGSGNFTGRISFGSEALFSDGASFGGTLMANGAAVFNDATDFNGVVSFEQQVNFDSGTSFNGGANFIGRAAFNEHVDFESSVSFNGGINIGGGYTFTDPVIFESQVSFEGALLLNCGILGNTISCNSIFAFGDGYNIQSGTATGTKLGSAANQKLGKWGATPIVQPTTSIAAATFVAGAGTPVTSTSTFDGYTLAQLARGLRLSGDFA